MRGARTAGVAVVLVLAGCAGTGPGGIEPAGTGSAEIGDVADCVADEVLTGMGIDGGPGGWTGRPAPAAERVPDGFEPVRVVECRMVVGEIRPLEPDRDLLEHLDPSEVDVNDLRTPGPTSPPGPPEVSLQQVEREGDLTRLLAALAEPSDRPREGQACPAMFEMKPALFLVDAEDRVVRAQWPTTSCGFLRPGAHEALASVPEVGGRTVTRTGRSTE